MEGRITLAGYDVNANNVAIVCPHVIEGNDILVFGHDNDGVMQFFCGCIPDENAEPIHVHHVLDWHPDVADLPTVPPGFYAERSARETPWIVKPQD